VAEDLSFAGGFGPVIFRDPGRCEDAESEGVGSAYGDDVYIMIYSRMMRMSVRFLLIVLFMLRLMLLFYSS